MFFFFLPSVLDNELDEHNKNIKSIIWWDFLYNFTRRLIYWW